MIYCTRSRFSRPMQTQWENFTPTPRQMPSPCRACGCWVVGVLRGPRSMRFAGVWRISQRDIGVLFGCVVALFQAIKKALNLKAFLRIYGAPGETRTPTSFENGF